MGPTYTMQNVINKHYSNVFDNIGDPTSFVWYGTYTSPTQVPS